MLSPQTKIKNKHSKRDEKFETLASLKDVTSLPISHIRLTHPYPHTPSPERHALYEVATGVSNDLGTTPCGLVSSPVEIINRDLFSREENELKNTSLV